jgi:nitrate/nitrite-specific signal transduction histidine kinase
MTIQQKANIFIFGEALFSLILVVYIFTNLNNLTSILNTELPDEIISLNKSVYIKYLSDQTLYMDEVLTQSARNYAFTKDERWKARYFENKIMLDSIIRQALVSGERKDALNFQRLNDVNTQLVDLEYISLDLTDNKQQEEAIAILESEEYWTLKSDYAASLQDYRDSKDKAVVDVLGNIESLVIQQGQKEQNMVLNLKLGFISYTAIFLAITWTFLFLFMRFIVRGILILKDGAESIKQGNFNHKIFFPSKDELGELAFAFNSMAGNLERMTREINMEVLERQLADQRYQFSRELHDRLGIIISSIKIQLNKIKQEYQQNPLTVKELDDCEKLVDEAYSQVREIGSNPVPETIIENGLKQSLVNLFARAEMIFKVPITFITNLEEDHFPANDKASVYSLIRELLNNAMKHAKCTEINCQIITHDDYTQIMFEDNGIGFEPAKIDQVEGKGIKNAKARIAQLGGDIFIDSHPERGSTIIIDIPRKGKVRLETL